MSVTAFVVALSLSAAVVADERTYVCEQFGFRITRPTESWGYYATRTEPGALLALSLFPRGSIGLPMVVVYVTDWDGTSQAEVVRAASAQRLASEGAHQLVQGSTRLGERDVPWVRAVAKASDSASDVTYHYLVAKPYLYTLEIAHQPGDEESRRLLTGALESFDVFPPQSEPVRPNQSQWQALADRCGSEVAWCKTWAEAAERAKQEHKLVLVVFENYTVLEVPKTARSGPFMDPDFVALVQERFVVLPMSANDAAPFRAADVYGLSEHSWGTSFLFVKPSGEVVRETGIANASHLAQEAREVLAGAGERVAVAGDKLDAAEQCLRRGDLEHADQLLAGASTARGHRLRATLFRQLRKGDEALAELRAARNLVSAELASDIMIDEGVILMRQGKYDVAEPRFARAVNEFPDRERSLEARYWLGAFEVLRSGVDAGASHWRELVASHPESRWAWKAAADLIEIGAFINGGERLEWPDEALVRSVARPGFAQVDATDRVQRDAVAFLLANQRADGSWTNPSDAFGLGANLYTPAVTAIAAWSLVALDDQHAVSNAVRRALAYTLDSYRTGKLDPAEGLAGAYSIWARTFVLRFLIECARAGIGDRADLMRVMAELVQSIRSSQHPAGGWPYVTLPSDPSGSGFDPSASFLSAGVLMVLLEAHDVHVPVARDTIDKAVAFLARLREKNGLFRYMPDVAQGDAFSEGAGRGPLCALALLRGGAGSIDLTRETLELFSARRAGFKKEWHKELCHTGPEGFGAHYLFYDYYFASAAVRELPKGEQAKYRAALQGDILAARLADGSFEDMPGLGREYATAMALLSLRELQPR